MHYQLETYTHPAPTEETALMQISNPVGAALDHGGLGLLAFLLGLMPNHNETFLTVEE